MKVVVLFVILVSLTNQSVILPQDYHPTIEPGSVWRVGIGQGMGSYYFIDYHLGCDTTTIQGNNYFRIVRNDNIAYECGESGYVREDIDEKKIYYLPESDTLQEELLVVDYNLEIGDTFYFHDGWGNLVVEDIEYTSFNNELVRTIVFDNDQNKFYEGVGSNSFGVIADCYYTSRLFSKTVESCDLVNVTSKRTINNYVVFPNPVDSKVSVEFLDDDSSMIVGELSLYSVTGSILRSTIVEYPISELDMNGYEAGVYYLVGKGPNWAFSEIIIKN